MHALSHKDGTGKNGPAAQMPHLCRARGLWGGPEPQEIADLAHAERRVIQLARLYVSVKRVFVDKVTFAWRGSSKEIPRYHEKMSWLTHRIPMRS